MAESTDESTTDVTETPDIEELVSQLRARVAARRETGEYPGDLEEQMTAHFRRILYQRRVPRALPDIESPLRAVSEALPLSPDKIPLESGLPGGHALHKAISRIVGRQTTGALQQVQAFAQPVHLALEALTLAIKDLSRTLHVDIAQSLDALYERQASQERAIAGAGLSDLRSRPAYFRPWYSSEKFEDTFRGSRETILERYRDLADRLLGCAPVLDVGCGRGELLELLEGLGMEARGVDTDPDLVKAAIERGLDVKEDDALRYLDGLDDHSLGAIVLIQVIEHLSAQEIVDFVALAAEKVRPGGRVFVEAPNPQSLYVFAHALFLDPTHLRPIHPAYLAFLFREAGFSSVDIEWRSPPPADDVLEAAPVEAEGAATYNENVRRLNQLLFAPQDYLIAATR